MAKRGALRPIEDDNIDIWQPLSTVKECIKLKYRLEWYSDSGCLTNICIVNNYGTKKSKSTVKCS